MSRPSAEICRSGLLRNATRIRYLPAHFDLFHRFRLTSDKPAIKIVSQLIKDSIGCGDIGVI